MTIVLGVVGSFVGGFLGYLIFHKDAQDGFFQPAGIIGAFIGAVIVLLIWTRVGGRRSVTRLSCCEAPLSRPELVERPILPSTGSGRVAANSSELCASIAR